MSVAPSPAPPPATPASPWQRVLSWVTSLSGTNLTLLDKIPDGEQRRLRWCGWTIIAAGVLAMASMTFLLTDLFHVPLPGALLFATGWGLMIGNLERLLAATLRAGQNLLSVLASRGALALLIGALIATPLMLHAFAPEIKVEVKSMQREERAAFDHRLAIDYARIDQLESEEKTLQTFLDAPADTSTGDDPAVAQARDRRDQLERSYSKAQAAVVAEEAGRGPTGKVGCGPTCKRLIKVRDGIKADLDRAENALQQTTTAAGGRVDTANRDKRTSASNRLAQIRTDLPPLRQARSDEQKAFDDAAAHSDGLLARLKALHHLAGRDITTLLAYLLLTAVLLTIDLLPVLAKTLLSQLDDARGRVGRRRTRLT